jgi:hypothetical protein
MSTKILEFPDCPYRFTLTPIKNGPHHGDSTRCLVEAVDGISMLRVGEFAFNYSHSLDKIIKPFKVGDDWYCTYSTSYTKIAVAKLTERFEHIDSDIGGEGGFCPVEVVIPYKVIWRKLPEEPVVYRWTYPKDDEYDDDPDYEVEYASFGFYQGCKWGDDSTYKLRYLDFSKLKDRKLGVSAPFGRFELPRDGRLVDHINLDHIDEGLLHLSRNEDFSERGDGTWRDYSTRSQQQQRAELLRTLAQEAFGDNAVAGQWLFAFHPELNGMRPDDATCTSEGTVKAIQLLYKDKQA